MASLLQAREQMPKSGMETSHIVRQEEVQDRTKSRKINAYIFWDLQGPILEQYVESGLPDRLISVT